MRNSHPQALNTLIDDIESFHTIQSRTIALAQLNKVIKSILPQQLQSACRIANYRHHVLIIEVSNASWLTRLRYEQEKLLSSLRQEMLPELASIQFTINPDLQVISRQANSLNQPYNKVKKTRVLSESSANILMNLAENCPDTLKEKLIKLASYTKKTNNCNHES